MACLEGLPQFGRLQSLVHGSLERLDYELPSERDIPAGFVVETFLPNHSPIANIRMREIVHVMPKLVAKSPTVCPMQRNMNPPSLTTYLDHHRCPGYALRVPH